MTILRVFLAFSTVLIYAITALAVAQQGPNWPAVAFADVIALGWRSQFDLDFLVHLFLLAAWVVWREGATGRAYLFGVLSIVMGGMFSFPYLIYATYAARGEPVALLLGVRASAHAR